MSQDKREANIEKCKGRRASIKEATPPWLTQEHKDMIKRMYTFAKALNEQGGVKYHVDHIVPLNHPMVCGLHVPWNLQILDEKDNKAKGNRLDTEPIKGAITIDQILEMGNMGIRYKGRFLKGMSGNLEGRPSEIDRVENMFTKSLDSDSEFSEIVKKIDKETQDDREFVEKSISLLMRSAKSPTELYRYLRDFAPYYQPKISNVDSGKEGDRDIVIQILRPDDNK